MARRQPGGKSGARSGPRPGRGSASGVRSSASGRRGMLGGLAVVAAALAGGGYLYLHTPAAPRATTTAAPAVGQSAPARRAPAEAEPYTVAPGTAAPAPTGAEAPASSARAAGAPAAPLLAPFGTSEEVFEAGARLYAANCASCHGRPGSNGKGPLAAQFWDPANPAGIHAISEPVGVLYRATAKGNLTQGMPSYGQRLTDAQIWDLALLLKSAHDDLPDPVGPPSAP